MAEEGSHGFPKISALVAFECAARHRNFSRAAEELGVSQPAISRHIANLEEQLSTRLFERSRKGALLTDAGRRYCDAVVTGLGIIRAATVETATQPHVEQVVVACSEDASNFYVMPQYRALQKTLGEQVKIRILTFQHSATQLPLDPPADVVLAWDSNIVEEDFAGIHEEAVRPLCSSGYAAAHAETLGQPVNFWGGLTFLDVIPPNLGWASWGDWFRVVGRPLATPRFRGFDSYAYLLEAAAAGDGIALGWKYYVERYLESGALIPLTDDFVEFRSRYCGYLTERGRSRAIAHQCLSFFGQCAEPGLLGVP